MSKRGRFMAIDDATRAVRRAIGRRVAGYCYVASEAIYHLAGGRHTGLVPVVLRAPWPPRRLTTQARRCAELVRGTHWWLEDRSVDPPRAIDVTAGQFRPRLTRAERRLARGCGFLTKRPSVGAREIIAAVRGGV